MPATSARKPSRKHVLGVDGCRGGWICARLEVETLAVETAYAEDFRAVLDGPARDAAAILVDMPIGLADAGARACESAARARLAARRSSVFSAPRRPMLAFATYAEANAWGKANGAGLSKQAFNIMAKIAEIDRLVTPADQARIGEGHPELAFMRLGGAPCAYPKRTRQGLAERRALLARAGLAVDDALVAEARRVSSGRAKEDDVLDALALSLAAAARLDGRALRLSDEARDARGLVMEIWG